jgi:hypothetical protein
LVYGICTISIKSGFEFLHYLPRLKLLVRVELFNPYFAFTHPIFLYISPILITKYYDMSLLLLFIPVLLKISLTLWLSFSCLWPITCHVQNYYDILQFWGFSPKQKLPALFITKKR